MVGRPPRAAAARLCVLVTGITVRGKGAVLISMNQGMEKLLKRISRSTKSGRSELVSQNLKVRGEGPFRVSTAGGGGGEVWRMVFVFKLYVMQVRIQASRWSRRW